MATKAYKGSQTLLQVETGSPLAFTTVEEIRTISGLGVSNETLEVTHMLSLAKEYIPGLPDGIEMSFSCNYIPDSPTQLDLIDAVNTGLQKDFKYTTPPASSGGGVAHAFTLAMLGWNLPTTNPNEPVLIEFRGKISGEIVSTPVP